MRRYPSLPRLCTWLAVVTATAAGHCSSNAFAQPSTAAPRVAALPANPAAIAPAAPQVDPLLEQIDRAIEVTSKRYLTVNVHSPWQIFHGILALKQDFQLNLDPTGKEKVNALKWIATSEPRFDKLPLLLKTPHGGKFHSFTRAYAFEGHPSQFLALMSQSDLPLEYSFKVGHEQITLADIIQNTMQEVNSKEEVTWVLWSLQHYLKPDANWTNQHGEAWSIEKLVQIETAAPVVGAACGGNHRLFALTRTRDKHLKLGGTLNGVWAQADLKIRQHVELARQLQNSDGSFSSKFYQGPDVTNDVNLRFNTTGHTMEFLSIGLPSSRLNETWVRNATWTLSRELVQHRQRLIDCGPLYHSLNALMIYRERLKTQLQPAQVAKAVDAVQPISLPNLDSSATPVAKAPAAMLLKDRPEAVTAPGTLDVRKPTEATPPVGPATKGAKPTVATQTEEPTPSAVAPSVDAESEASKRPMSLPAMSILKTIDPGRVVQLRPIEYPHKEVRPGLLPNVAATPIEVFELPYNDPVSLDSTIGTLKPHFGNPPPASRASTSKTVAKTISILTAAPPTTPVDDEPVSATAPANR